MLSTRFLLLLFCQIVLVLFHQAFSQEPERGNLELTRHARQLGLGNILNVGGNQGNRNGPVCQGPGGQRGRCLAMEKCVLKELDDNYIKNKEYFCAISRRGPVGVCCPDSVAKPVVYREGMFGNKNVFFGRTNDEEDIETSTTRSDVEMI